MPIKFHFDEHVNPAIASGLRRRGVGVVTTVELNLTGEADATHITVASLANHVIYTNDRDFLRAAASGIPHCGIVYSQSGHRSIGEIIDALVLIHACMTAQEMRDHVEFI